MGELIFVDCEAVGPSPSTGVMTEFGAVAFRTDAHFHGQVHGAAAFPYKDLPPVLPHDPAFPNRLHQVMAEFDAWLRDHSAGRPIFVSDNPAFDFQWINDAFWKTLGRNPFGHSGRRIGDFYAGLRGNFKMTQEWKKLRVTPHDHNPVNDARGNKEAFERILNGER